VSSHRLKRTNQWDLLVPVGVNTTQQNQETHALFSLLRPYAPPGAKRSDDDDDDDDDTLF